MNIAGNNSQQLAASIQDQTAVIGVVGLGYVGLPLAQTFLNHGFRCLGFDIDKKKTALIQAGESYIKHIDSEWIAAQVATGQLQATSQMDRLAEADAILICVPTPLTADRQPDLSYVRATSEQLAAVLRPGQLVVLESTTYPGTTRDVVLPILQSSGLALGSDFFLAYSPEREDPGNEKFTAGSIPKVVGGMDSISLQLADELYSQVVVQTVPVSSCEVAEACKILENTYRSVNIAMVNEMKLLMDAIGIDVWEVIEAASTKPFGFQPFYPGPGLGGHCIPIDPFYLSWLARQHSMEARFIELAGEVNSSMPAHVVGQIQRALEASGRALAGARVGILGVAYKPNVDDPRESPAFRLLELLEAATAELSYNDPYIPQLPQMRSFQVPQLSSQPLTREYLSSLDCLVVVTDHDQYDWEFIATHAPLIIDTRNALKDQPHAAGKTWKA